MGARPETEKGVTLFEILVTVAVGALLMIAVLYAANAFNHSLRQSATLQAATTGAETLIDSLERDAHSGQAIFTPRLDVAGNDNSDGHELGFYARDTAGAGHFWSYCYKIGLGKCSTMQATTAIALYRYAWSELPQNGGAGATLDGTIAENVTAFRSQTWPASALLDSTINPISAAYFRQIGITRVVDVPRQMGFPGVVAGNRVTIVTLQTAAGPRVVHLLASEMTTRRLVIVGTYTPPPNALNVPNGSSLHFWSPLAAQQSATIAESNYGTRTTNPPQVYTIIGTSCPPYTTWNPSPTIVPIPDGRGAAQLNVTPIKRVASSGETCGYTIADNVGQTTTIGVIVDPTQAPAASYLAPPNPIVGQTLTFSVHEGNYAQAPLGGFSASLIGPCDSGAFQSASGGGGFGTAPETESWNVHANAPGACTITFTDKYGQQAQASVVIGPALPTPTPAATAPPSDCTVYTGGLNGQSGQTWTPAAVTWDMNASLFRLQWPAGSSGRSNYLDGYYAPQSDYVDLGNGTGYVNGDVLTYGGVDGAIVGNCVAALPVAPTQAPSVNNTFNTCDPSQNGRQYFNNSGGVDTYVYNLDGSCGGPTPAPVATSTPAPLGPCAAYPGSTSSGGDCIGPCQTGPSGQSQMPNWSQGWWYPTGQMGCSGGSTPAPSPTTTNGVLPTPLPTTCPDGSLLSSHLGNACPTSPPSFQTRVISQQVIYCKNSVGAVGPCDNGGTQVADTLYSCQVLLGGTWTTYYGPVDSATYAAGGCPPYP